MFDKISAISSSGDENTPEMNMSILDRVRFALSEFPLKKYSPQNAFAGAQGMKSVVVLRKAKDRFLRALERAGGDASTTINLLKQR